MLKKNYLNHVKMKQKDVFNFIKEKFNIDITNYNQEELEKILLIIEKYLLKEIELNNNINKENNKVLKNLLEQINNTLM